MDGKYNISGMGKILPGMWILTKYCCSSYMLNEIDKDKRKVLLKIRRVQKVYWLEPGSRLGLDLDELKLAVGGQNHWTVYT